MSAGNPHPWTESPELTDQEEVINWAKQVFGSVLEDLTDQANAELGLLDTDSVWWISEKAERLMMLAKCVLEERE